MSNGSDPSIVIVTGAAQGIGLAIADAFLARGDTVIGYDIDVSALAAAEQTFAGAAGRFIGIALDAGDVAAITTAVDDVVATHGRIDVLVNNAGVTRRADVLELAEADWDRITRVNAKGVFFFMQAVARAMAARGDGGRIINIASIAGFGFRASSNVIYAGTKGAVIAMTKMEAAQLGRHDITVNAVCPGITDTAIYQGIISRDAEQQGRPVDDVRADALRNVPLGRANTTGDVADMVVYFASPGARNVTGQAVIIDGGLTL